MFTSLIFHEIAFNEIAFNKCFVLVLGLILVTLVLLFFLGNNQNNDEKYD